MSLKRLDKLVGSRKDDERKRCVNYEEDYFKRCVGYLYAIDVKEKAGLPLAGYLWRTLVEMNKTPTPVCFYYGEAHWLQGQSWQSVRDKAIASHQYTCPLPPSNS